VTGGAAAAVTAAGSEAALSGGASAVSKVSRVARADRSSPPRPATSHQPAPSTHRAAPARVAGRRQRFHTPGPPSGDPVGPGHGGATAVPLDRMLSSAWISCAVVASHCLWLISMAWRRARGLRSSGSSSARGIRAPPTSTGTTRMPRCNAVTVSSRMKSCGSSRRRRPAASVVDSHSSPMMTTSTRQEPTASSIAVTKSVPSSMPSTSMKTRWEPKWGTRRSYRRPA